MSTTTTIPNKPLPRGSASQRDIRANYSDRANKLFTLRNARKAAQKLRNNAAARKKRQLRKTNTAAAIMLGEAQ